MRVAFAGASPRAVVAAQTLRACGAGLPIGLWNRSPERAQAVAAELDVPAFPTVGAMVEQQQPDVVAIMTHPAARAELVASAREAGATALLIEKPIALSLDELAEVERLADGAFVAVNTQYQWMAHWRSILALVGDGALGEVRQIRASVGVDILEQGPHALSLAMAVAARAGLRAPTWVVAGGSGEHRFGEVAVPDDTVALFDLGEARLALAAGPAAPRVPGETVIHFQQQTEIVGSRGRAWVSLDQGAEIWTADGFRAETTQWSRDDAASQSGLWLDLAAAVADPARQAGFPTRLEAAATQARMLFGAIQAARTGSRVDLTGP